MNQEEFARLVRSLVALPRESEWVELTLEEACRPPYVLGG